MNLTVNGGSHDIDPVLSDHVCASAAGISIWTWKGIVKKGLVRRVQMSPRRVGVRRSELERYLKSCEVS